MKIETKIQINSLNVARKLCWFPLKFLQGKSTNPRLCLVMLTKKVWILLSKFFVLISLIST